TESVMRHRLQDLNRLLIEALESARDGIMITDLQGTLLHVNGALERMTGYGREQLLGQTPRLLKSGLHPPEFYASMWRTILARIQGYAALGLREPGLSDPLREFLQYVVQLSERAANLTRQLLAFARKPALSRQPLRMDKLVRGTADLVRHTLCVEVALEVQEQ